jgi:hypothetical protein
MQVRVFVFKWYTLSKLAIKLLALVQKQRKSSLYYLCFVTNRREFDNLPATIKTNVVITGLYTIVKKYEIISPLTRALLPTFTF